MLTTSLLAQDNQDVSETETSANDRLEIDEHQETRNKSVDRTANASLDLGPLGLIEKHAPAVYAILEDPDWQDLDEIGRHRMLVPQLRIAWGLESDDSQDLLDALESIDQQIASGKQKRLARNTKRILGRAQDTLFRQFSLGLEWVAYREELWKEAEFADAIPPESLDGYQDCIKSCESKLFACFAQSESDFEGEVIGEIETALSDPSRNRSSVRKWRSLEPAKGTYRLFLSMIDCNQNFLRRDGLECDRIIFFGTTNPAAKVEFPEEPASTLNPDSRENDRAADAKPGTS